MTIDAHQHFWKYDPVRDSWMSEDMQAIKKDFLPADLAPILKENNVDGCVVVQSDQSENENDFQLKNATANDFVKGVVGWVDLIAEDIEERLIHYRQYEKLKGFRHVLQGEPQRDYMLRPDFMRGIGLLKKYGFTYDILVLPDQLCFSKQLAAAFPDQLFVIDHLAKPLIKTKEIKDWENDMRVFKEYENVFCKISGMVTEADWQNWKPEDFTPYIDVVLDTFGTSRIMYGSDWPVCNVASSYKSMKQIVNGYFESFSADEQAAFFGRNAATFYRL